MNRRSAAILPQILLALTLCGALTGTVATTPLQAQAIPAEPSFAKPILAGLGLGAVGFLGGAFAGSLFSKGCDGAFCELGGAAGGALIGESAGMGLGVHLGNRQRGNLPLDLVTAAGSATGALLLLNSSEEDEGRLLLLALAVQTTATVAVERISGRARERRAALSIAPTREGAIRIGVEVPLR